MVSVPSPVAASRQVLREAKGPIPFVAFGDSVFFGDNDNNSSTTGGLSIITQIAWRSGGRLGIRRNAGIPGQTATQIVQRAADEGLYLGAPLALNMMGVNDVIQGVSQSITLLRHKQLIRAEHAAGMFAVTVALPPSDANAAGNLALNAAISAVALAEGAIFVDPWVAIRASDGKYVAGASGDGIHPVQASTALAALAFLADSQIVGLLPSYSFSSLMDSTETWNPVPGALFDSTYTSGSNVIPSQWTLSSYNGTPTGTWTATVAPDVSGTPALATLVASAGATGSYSYQSVDFFIGRYAGKRISFSGRLKISGIPASGGQAIVRVSQSTGAIDNITFYPMSTLKTDGDGYFYGEFQVPAGATNAFITVQLDGVTSGGCSLSVGEMVMRPTDFQGLDIRARRVPKRIARVTATAAIALDSEIIEVDATAGPVTVTLPTAGNGLYGFGAYTTAYQMRVPGGGLEYVVVKVDASANAVTVAAPAGATIEGAASVSLTTQYAKAALIAVRSTLYVKR